MIVFHKTTCYAFVFNKREKFIIYTFDRSQSFTVEEQFKFLKKEYKFLFLQEQKRRKQINSIKRQIKKTEKESNMLFYNSHYKNPFSKFYLKDLVL